MPRKRWHPQNCEGDRGKTSSSPVVGVDFPGAGFAFEVNSNIPPEQAKDGNPRYDGQGWFHSVQMLHGLSASGERYPVDNVFVARTGAEGRTWQPLSWIVPTSAPYRSVMPPTVRSSGDSGPCVVHMGELDACQPGAPIFVLADDLGWVIQQAIEMTGSRPFGFPNGERRGRARSQKSLLNPQVHPPSTTRLWPFT